MGWCVAWCGASGVATPAGGGVPKCDSIGGRVREAVLTNCDTVHLIGRVLRRRVGVGFFFFQGICGGGVGEGVRVLVSIQPGILCDGAGGIVEKEFVVLVT
jgi:DnaJ-class molecular chaperone